MMLLIVFYIYRQSVQLSFLMSIVTLLYFFGGREGVSRGNRGQLKNCLQMRVWLLLFLFAMDCLLICVERLNRINLRSTEIC